MAIDALVSMATAGATALGGSALKAGAKAVSSQLSKTGLRLSSKVGSARNVVGNGLQKVSTKLFGKGGALNSNRYLRIGFSRDGGERVFRIAGDLVEKYVPKSLKTDSRHIILNRLGPL